MTTPQLKCPRPGRRGRLRIPSAPWTRDRGGGRLRQHPLSGPPPSLRPVPRHPSPPTPTLPDDDAATVRRGHQSSPHPHPSRHHRWAGFELSCLRAHQRLPLRGPFHRPTSSPFAVQSLCPWPLSHRYQHYCSSTHGHRHECRRHRRPSLCPRPRWYSRLVVGSLGVLI